MSLSEQLCMGCMSDRVDEGICPNCGYDSRSPYDQNYLAPGEVLESRYIVGAVKQRNGEGASYIGYDEQTQSRVWVREYFPYTISHRDEDGSIMPNSGLGAQYKALMSDYVDVSNEVKRLGTSEPIVPVEDILGINNTVYVVYRYIDGLSLEEYLTTRGGKLSQAEALDMLLPLFHAVDNIHLRGIIHRGLSPFTLLVSTAGKLYLDGFALSGTRTGGSELQAELFNGYSAPEQYATKGWQGTWTDVYALAAVLYRCISGVVPPKSTMVSSGRPLAMLKDLVPSASERVSSAIAEGMRINTEARTQTVGSFISALQENNGDPQTAVFDFVPTSFGEKIPPARESRGQAEFQTEEVSFDEINQEFHFATPKTPQENRGRYDDDEYDDYDDEYDARPPQRGKKAITGLAIFAIIAVIVVAAIIMAVVITNRVINDGKSSQPEVTISEESDKSEPESTPEKDSSEDDPSEEEKEVELDIPSFVGRKLEDIEKDLVYKENFTFKVVEEENKEHAKGIIVAQEPKKGEKIKEGGEITLTVSAGIPKIVMPDVTGLTFNGAIERLTKFSDEQSIRLEVAQPIEIYVKDSPAGIVSRTLPAAGQEFDPATTTIELYVVMETVIKESSQTSAPASQPESSKESSKESSIEVSKPRESSKESSVPSKNESGVDVSPNKPPSRKS